MLNLSTNAHGQSQINLTRSDVHDLIAKLNDMLRKDEAINSGMPNVIPVMEPLMLLEGSEMKMVFLHMESMRNAPVAG